MDKQLQTEEQPLISMPAIWDGGQQAHSTPCDVIVTNQRLLGYYLVNWPRQRLFLDELRLAEVKGVSLRHKKHEPVFRELMVSTKQRNVYIRAPRNKIEALYHELHSAIESFTPTAEPAVAPAVTKAESTTIFERQEINKPFETSPLAIILLFIGGLLLEVIGILLWTSTQSAAVGTPLLIAGLIAVIVAMLIRRRIR